MECLVAPLGSRLLAGHRQAARMLRVRLSPPPSGPLPRIIPNIHHCQLDLPLPSACLFMSCLACPSQAQSMLATSVLCTAWLCSAFHACPSHVGPLGMARGFALRKPVLLYFDFTCTSQEKGAHPCGWAGMQAGMLRFAVGWGQCLHPGLLPGLLWSIW